MRRVAGAVLMLAATLVQVTWAPRLEVAGAFPNLVLLAVMGLAWTLGVRAGMAWACVGGLMLDLTAPGPLGPHALALVCGAYVTGFWARNVERESPFHPAVAAIMSSALYSMILIGADDAVGLPVPPVQLAVQLTLAACVYNALMMPAALAMLRRLQMLVRSRPVVA